MFEFLVNGARNSIGRVPPLQGGSYR
ncbi:uncharacterized protein METZ01_LOCUS105987, partial [marine metagenome]